MVKYLIATYYGHRYHVKCFEKTYVCETYDDAIAMNSSDCRKQGIHYNRIISWKVIKIITCPKCGHDVLLRGIRNECDCGSIYNEMGNSIIHQAI